MIVGLDLSLNSTGIALAYDDSNSPKYGSVDVSIITTDRNTNYYDRIHYIWDQIQTKVFTQTGRPASFFIEDYSFGAFGKSSSVTKLAELGGYIKVNLHTHGLCNMITLVPATVIKKFICGFGNAKKSDMKLEFFKKYELSYKTDDEVDAHSLLILGAASLGKDLHAKAWTGYEMDCIKKVKGLIYPSATLVDRLSRV